MKIIWVDGIFGSGKTAVANGLVKKISNALLFEFDALQDKYEPKGLVDLMGERYPSAKRYLVDACICEMKQLIQNESYDYLVIPIALINDYCNEKLVKGFKDINSFHFILSATYEVWNQRISKQTHRDMDLALTYRTPAITYLETHYPDAIRIDTSNMEIDDVVERIVEIIA